VSSRRKIAQYAYDRAASGEGTWPNIDSPVESRLIDEYVSNIQLGPTPVTIASLEAHPNEYLPWMYQVLQRLEARVLIQEPVPQIYASRAYIHRKLKEVSSSPRNE
jgi:hypothetical protein